jgi:uncharacterized protein YukE
MKKKFISLVSLSLVLSLSLVSCGGSKDEGASSAKSPEMPAGSEGSSEASVSQTPPSAADLDVTTITSVEQASNEYKELLSEYSEKVKSSSKEEAEELKSKLDELEKYSKEKFKTSELKAMVGLTKLALQLQSGKDVDLDKAFAAYDEVLGKTLEAMKDLGAGDAIKGYGDAMKNAEDAMQKMQDEYDNN